MATMQTMLDDLNSRMGDANNAASVGEATKMRWINHGIRAMWPKIWIAVQDATLSYTDGTFSYSVPAGVGTNSEIVRVEIQSAASGGYYSEVIVDELPLRVSRTLQFDPRVRFNTGSHIRITAIRPVAVMAAVGDTYEGYPITEELPVLYAMYLATSRGHEDRVDYTRYSTVAAQNRVDIGEVEGAALFWLSQFEAMLDRLAMPWPASVG